MTNDPHPHRSHGDDTDQMPLDFAAFHAMNRATYVHYAERRLGSRRDAEEVVDHVFEQLLIGWDSVLRSRNLAAYAQAVLKNRIIDYKRSLGKAPELHEHALFETLAMQQTNDPIGQFEESAWLQHAIAQLPPARREVAVLLHYEGFTPKEVADFLGMTEGGVRSTKRYIYGQLKAMLQEEGKR